MCLFVVKKFFNFYILSQNKFSYYNSINLFLTNVYLNKIYLINNIK